MLILIVLILAIRGSYNLGFLQSGVYISVSYMTHLCPVIDIDRCSLHLGVQMNMSYITGLWGSYDQGFLRSGVLSIRGSYDQGFLRSGVLQPGVLTIGGSHVHKQGFKSTCLT